MQWKPWTLKLALRFFPPYVGAGIKVTHIDGEWRSLEVAMTLRWYNKNAVGTHFGGNLYSMVDPHLMLLLMNSLGRDYIVWDKAAEIDFKQPGRGRVTCKLHITSDELEQIRSATQSGAPYLPIYHLVIRDEQDQVVAKVKKVLYVRKRPRS